SAAAATGVLQPGMRFTWYGSSASIPGESQQLEPDSNGEWVNQATGQRYGQFDTPGPAGAGLAVLDVLAAGPEGFLLNLSQLLIHTDAGNATSFIDSNGLTSGTDGIGDFWVSPARLAALTDTDIGGSRVLHMPYALAGRNYRAVRLQVQGGGGWSQTTFDLDTGLAIVSSSTAQSGPVLIRDPNNQLAQGAGNTLMTYGQFAGSRQTNLPGKGSTYPDAIRGLRSLTYSGTRGIVISGSDMQMPPSPIELRYDVSSNPGPYLTARLSMSSFMGLPATAADRLVPAGTVGSLWMSPNDLAGYRQGELVDQDPISGVQVMAMGRLDNLAVLSARTSLTQYSAGYDLRSGLLTRADLRQQVGPATDILAVQLMGTQ
ncbi:MAG: hypothetical protein ACHQAQ_11545, partial [Hyphomicrobiales bacterium]